MSRLFYHVMQDNLGNLLFDVSGTMRLAGTGTLASIYGDAALSVPIANPMTNHPSYGSFKCYLGAGTYDFYMAKSGYSFETLTGLAGGGSMANQEAGAVAITGGSATLASATLTTLGVASAPIGPSSVFVRHGKAAGVAGLTIQSSDSNTGSGAEVLFFNIAGNPIGFIATTDTATSYNTTSDGRLKEAIEALPEALATVLALAPVRFRWKATGRVGHGLVAQDVQAVLPEVVSGDAAGAVPLGIDYARVVPWLVGAIKELTAQVELLTARCNASGA